MSLEPRRFPPCGHCGIPMQWDGFRWQHTSRAYMCRDPFGALMGTYAELTPAPTAAGRGRHVS